MDENLFKSPFNEASDEPLDELPDEPAQESPMNL